MKDKFYVRVEFLGSISFLNRLQAIPIFWILMPNKVHGSYVHVWKFLKHNFPNFKPSQCTMDYELAERNSIKQVFTGIIVDGCYFHYAKCLWKNAVRKGFALCKNNKTKRPNVHYFVKQMIALALLPVDKIPQAYAKLNQRALQMFPNNIGLLKFFRYYEKVWLSEKSRYKPHDFCFYEKIHRTNNDVESYHSRLVKLLKAKPTPKIFLSTFIVLCRPYNPLID